MKNTRLFFFAAFLALTSTGFAQAIELVYIRIQEKLAGAAYESFISISYPDQTSKRVELDKLGLGGSGAEPNGKIIQREIAILLNEGYQIASTSSGSGDVLYSTTMFLTRKKEK
jgi:hypothetical protein